MYQNISIGKIAKEIKSNSPVIFCGAGISFNSGIPIVPIFLNYLYSKLGLTPEQADRIRDANLPFESIVEMVSRESGIDEIQQVFSEGKPNSSHIFIANLLKEKYVTTVCTTNFDSLIEQSLMSVGLMEGKDFVVYSSEEDFKHIPWEKDIRKVIKIHGCVKKAGEMAITMSQIASARYSHIRGEVLRKIFAENLYKQVIILGYSCSDIDLVPHIESFNGSLASILFIEHDQRNIESFKVEPAALKESKNPFKNFSGNRIYVNTDDLVKGLWNEILNEEYFFKQELDPPWKSFLDQWYATAEIESGKGVKHHISSRLLYSVAAFHDAINHHIKAIEIALKDKNILAYASEVGNLGMAYNAIGEYERAQSCLNKSIPICKEINHTKGLSAQLQALGNILHHLGNNEAAINAHEEALLYAKADNDEFAICNILGNIGNAYNKLGEYSKALCSVGRGLALARKLGNIQAESSQLGIIAITYLYLGKYDLAIENCTKGIQIKNAIGDRNGECLMLANLINIYINASMKAEAAKTIEQCLQLAKKIDNKHVAKLAMLNLQLLG